MSVHVRIVQGNELVVDLPEWPYEVPAVGDYIFHPPLGGSMEGIAGCVRTRTWRTHDRQPGQFVQTAHPYVELTL